MKTFGKFLLSNRVALSAISLFLFAGTAIMLQTSAQTVFPSANANDIRGFTLTNANVSTNVASVTVTALNLNRSAIPGAQFTFYFSAASNGYAVNTTAGTSIAHQSGYGSVAGSVAATYTTTVALSAIANASGQFKVNVSPNITGAMYPVAFAQTTGIRAVGTVLTASYTAGLDIPSEYDFRKNPQNLFAALTRKSLFRPY